MKMTANSEYYPITHDKFAINRHMKSLLLLKKCHSGFLSPAKTQRKGYISMKQSGRIEDLILFLTNLCTLV